MFYNYIWLYLILKTLTIGVIIFISSNSIPNKKLEYDVANATKLLFKIVGIKQNNLFGLFSQFTSILLARFVISNFNSEDDDEELILVVSATPIFWMCFF